MITQAVSTDAILNYLTYSGPAVAWVLKADTGASESLLKDLCHKRKLLSRRLEGKVFYGIQCEQWDKWNKYVGERNGRHD